LAETLVGLFVDSELTYPKDNFNPPERYPEYPYLDDALNPHNRLYSAVRQLFKQMHLDEKNYDTPDWNPLGHYIRPGDKIAIKPNFVTDRHQKGVAALQATVTHPSVLRAVIDYAFIATGREGIINIVDGPLDMADFDNILRVTGEESMIDDLRQKKQLEIHLHDLRRWRTYWVDSDVRRFDLPGDPLGYVNIDLMSDSELLRGVEPVLIKNYRSTASYFEKRRIGDWHNLEHNLYSFSRTVMESDVFINIPKMKTHKKAGVTLSLKNIVGVTDAKDTLPHHRIGRPSNGGDELPDESSLAMRFKAFLIDNVISSPHGLNAYRLIRPIYRKMLNRGIYGKPEQRDRGEWYGNDTIWRTTLDLNKILMYADTQGKMHDTRRRRFFSLVDGIVAGEGNGPLNPSAVNCGCLVAGDDPVAVDLVCVRMLGFDWKRIPTYAQIKHIDHYKIGCYRTDMIEIVSNEQRYLDMFSHSKCIFSSKPADGWNGNIEL
jgi:uncharacterized protein (DUF362 family)